jgi:urease accessory protein
MKSSSVMYPIIRCMGFLLFMFIPALAQAHPGLSGHTHGFANGLLHPLSGWDHLLAMTAVGVWAVQCGRRALWLVPLAFVSVMTLGGILGRAGIGQIPWIEQGIAASVLILGIFIATAVQLPLSAAALIVVVFALFHGYAHGAEMPATVSGWLYGLGFVVATAGLHLFGIGMGLTAQRLNSMKLVRCVGGVIAACGIYLFFSV